MKGITDIPGIQVGHATDLEGRTGVTVVLCEKGAVAGFDIGGSATGSSELDVMNPLHITSSIHAVTMAGGSAFGLEAACGVRRFLEQHGVGFPYGGSRIPIVPGMILFDLGFAKPGVRPTREMGETAAAAATDEAVVEGCVGAGTGATVGKLFGLARAMKGGIGSYTVPCGKAKVSAIVAVNAFGDVRDPASGKLLAGCRKSEKSRDLLDTEKALLAGARRENAVAPANTTLCVVATDAKLSKVGATRLAKRGQAGVLRALSPGHATVDGDVVIAMSCGEIVEDTDALGVAAAEAVGQSIVRAVKAARTMSGVPGLAR
ncbi:MAG: P1 family peptidase [Acidobacteria bacterium]|nr:P1 family peptidase [Acidobacteriota bacterium]